MMVKIWIKEVYEKNEIKIMKSFINILFKSRRKHIEYLLSNKDGKNK